MPTYLFCILFYWKLLPFVGNDSDFYPYIDDSSNSCNDTWWRNLLLIDNFWKTDSCFGWGWYLACDF
jgi:hypothetical protein